MNKRVEHISELSQSDKEFIVRALQAFYALKDIDENCDGYYVDLFNALYVDVKKLSYDSLAQKFHISFSKLKRFVKSVDALAVELLQNKDIYLQLFKF